MPPKRIDVTHLNIFSQEYVVKTTSYTATYYKKIITHFLRLQSNIILGLRFEYSPCMEVHAPLGDNCLPQILVKGESQLLYSHNNMNLQCKSQQKVLKNDIKCVK